MTFTSPDLVKFEAPVVQSSEESDTTTGDAQVTPSKVTEIAPLVNPDPLIVTAVPPAFVPELGEIPATEMFGVGVGLGVGVGVGVSSGAGAATSGVVEASFPLPILQLAENKNVMRAKTTKPLSKNLRMFLYRPIGGIHELEKAFIE